MFVWPRARLCYTHTHAGPSGVSRQDEACIYAAFIQNPVVPHLPAGLFQGVWVGCVFFCFLGSLECCETIIK